MIASRSLITLLAVGLALPGVAAEPVAREVPRLTIYTADGVEVASREQPIDCHVSMALGAAEASADDPATVPAALPAKIRGRGNTTWSYPKKPYRVKFAAPVDLLGMGAARTWVLLADYIDPSGLRNATAFELGRRLAMPFTPQCRHVTLVLNGSDRGLYLLTEQTEVAPERVATDAETGFLVEFDDYDGEEIFSTPILDLPLKIKRPDLDDLAPAARDAVIARVTGVFAGLEKALTQPDGPGDYAALLDVDSLVDWFLVHEITHNYEPRHPKSCFFHRGPDGRIAAGPLWDFDYEEPSTDVLLLKEKFWFPYLFKDPAFRARLKARWAAIKAAHVDTLPAYVNTLAASLRDSVEQDRRLWPCDDETRCPADAARLTKWLVARIAALDAAIADL